MSAFYRETPCGHCGELGRAAASCPDCRRLVCETCLGAERCPTPAPRVHQLGVGRRIVGLERKGKAALYATQKGQLRTFDLAHGRRVRFPSTSSGAHQRLAAGGRWPWVALLEGGAMVAKLQIRHGRTELRLRRKGKGEEVFSSFFSPQQHQLRLFTAADESLLFATAHDRLGQALLHCYGVVGAAKLVRTIALDDILRQAALLDERLIALAAGRELHFYRFSNGKLISRIESDARWLGVAGKELIVVEKAHVTRMFSTPEQRLEVDRSWRVPLPEPTMAAAPGDASLSLDGSMLALLGKTRRRLLLVDMDKEELAGVLAYEAEIDLVRFVGGDRLLVALANGKIIEHWQRSLLSV